MKTVRLQAEPKRTCLYLHVPRPERGLTIEGQALPNLPGSVRAVFATSRQTPKAADVKAFLDTVNGTMQRLAIEQYRTGWVQQTFITPDTDALSARASP